jgi:hypothetical protein
MCRVSEKIKFCTCGVSSTANLKHYWVFFRHNKKKNQFIIGDVMMPPQLASTDVDAYNEAFLQKRVNEQGAFDVELNPSRLDRLLIAIRVGDDRDSYLYYGYEWDGEKWESHAYDPFDWMSKWDEAQFGKTESALAK